MNEEAKVKQPTHGPYDEAFKRAAVAQWMSGVPARQVAAGLGITAESLRTWRKRQEGNVAPRAAVATAAVSAPTTGELQAEV